MVTNPRKSERKCPKCGKSMTTFNYRWEELELEMCPEHGFWLDKGEDDRITELMKKYEVEWKGAKKKRLAGINI